MTQPYHVPRFYLRQKVNPLAHQYVVQQADADGSEGAVLAFAQQKRLTFKDEVTFYTDDSKREKVFSFKARQRLDFSAGYDITDGGGNQLGFFRRDGVRSMLRSTFHVEGPGYEGTGQERSMAVALLRRFSDITFLPIHFDFVGSEGQPLISVERRMALRDKYTVTVPDQRVDFRVAAAVAVAMDALMAR